MGSSLPNHLARKLTRGIIEERGTAGNRWNVPIGIGVSKTARIGGLISKFELSFEYSVVTEDAYGQRAMVKLNVTPVIPSMIRKPLFGGR